MCGRYVLYTDQEQAEIRQIIEEVNKKHNFQVKKGDIYPSQKAPVFKGTPDHNGKYLDVMNWGYEVSFRKGLLINAKSETVLEKRTFSKDFKERRCLIPAQAFYEWDKEKNKIMFHSGNDLIYLGGIFRQHEDKEEYVILTKEPIKIVEEVHNRMPVIIPKNLAENWLYDTNDAIGIMGNNYVELERKQL